MTERIISGNVGGEAPDAAGHPSLLGRLFRHKKKVLFGLMLGALGMAALEWSDGHVTRAAQGLCFDRLEDVPPRRVGLVLGTTPHLADGKPNSYFWTRIDAAEQLFRAGKVQFLLISGDNSRVEYDEPTAMRDALIGRGIPAGVIYRDYAGFRTLDSMVRAREIFGVTECTVVSQRFHNERALFLGRSAGIDGVGFDASMPQGSVPRFKILLREKLARLAAVLDVYLLGTQPKFLGERIEIGRAPAN